LYFVHAYRDKKLSGVFVRFRAPSCSNSFQSEVSTWGNIW
jgi:hypothetical protein